MMELLDLGMAPLEDEQIEKFQCLELSIAHLLVNSDATWLKSHTLKCGLKLYYFISE